MVVTCVLNYLGTSIIEKYHVSRTLKSHLVAPSLLGTLLKGLQVPKHSSIIGERDLGDKIMEKLAMTGLKKTLLIATSLRFQIHARVRD